MPVFQTLEEAQTAFDAMEVEYNAEIVTRETAEASLATEQIARQSAETNYANELTARQQAVTELAQVKEEKATVELEREEAVEGLAISLAKVEQMKTPDGFIETINKASAQDKRELSIKARTTKEGIRAYVGFLFGMATADEASQGQSGNAEQASEDQASQGQAAKTAKELRQREDKATR